MDSAPEYPAGYKVDNIISVANLKEGDEASPLSNFGKSVSPELASRVSAALGLPEDFFVEARLATVIEALRDDPDWLESVYGQLVRRRKRRS